MKSLAIMLLVAIILSLSIGSGLAKVTAPENPPYLDVDIPNGVLLVHEITPDTDLYFEFFDDLNNPIKQLTMPSFGNSEYVLFEFQYQENLQPGYRVRVTDIDANRTAELTIKHILITDFESGSTTVGGEAESGARVDISIFNDTDSYPAEADEDGSGTWTKDMSQDYPGFVIGDDMSVVAAIADAEGDRSIHEIYPCNLGSEIDYSIDQGYIYACAAGGNVALQVTESEEVVFGPVELTADQDKFARIDFWRYGFDLAPGMVVQFQDLTESRLNALLIETFTGSYDEATNTLSGWAPPERTFAIEMAVNGGPAFHVPVTSEPDGYWEYALGDDELDGWTAFLYDGHGNAVLVDKGETIRPPRIRADLNHNSIIQRSFVPFTAGSVTVYDIGSTTGDEPLFSVLGTTDQNGDLVVNSGQYGVDLLPGMTISVTNTGGYPGHVYTRTLELEPNFITDFDPDTNILKGQTTPNEHLLVLGFSGSEIDRHERDALGDGSWEVSLNPALVINTIYVYVWDEDYDLTAFVLNEGEWVQLIDSGGATLVSTDEQGDQTVVSVPPGAVDEEISLSYSVDEAPQDVPDSFSFVGQAFSIETYKNGVLQPDYTFLEPVLVRLEYSDEDVINIDENSLTLDYWNESTDSWEDAATTCDPYSTYTRNLVENFVEVSICHLSDFALIGEDQFNVFLPLATSSG